MSVLSIQSHVAYGHVGNSAAVFPLQRLGYEVWPVHTLQYSNHAGYADFGGEVFTSRHVMAVLEGLARRGALAACDAVLSGYLGRADLGELVLEAVSRVRASRPQAIYLCDPVLGDTERGLYVKPDMVEMLRARALPRATIVTPNQFELARLSGVECGSLTEVLGAARRLLEAGPEVVLVTSLEHPGLAEEEIGILALSAEAAWQVVTPRLALDPAPHGAGDALAALFLAERLKGADLPDALARTAAAIFGLISATQRAGTRELRLIAAQDEIVRPSHSFEVEKLD